MYVLQSMSGSVSSTICSLCHGGNLDKIQERSQNFLKGFLKTVLCYQSRGLGAQTAAAEKL